METTKALDSLVFLKQKLVHILMTYLLRRDFWNEVREKLHNITIYNVYSNIYNKDVAVDSLHMDKVEDNEHTESDNKNIYRYSYTFTGKEEFTVKNSNIE